ncbi:MAG: class I SAM-dependent methyltransferase [Candidatus Omnitrophica bacterium]|nr:class I SAM-dependent methyltransferase [Candidatus Omnitrophota bacterium]
MSEDRASKEFQHHHKGKTSEALLDKNIILNALNLTCGQTVIDAGCGNGYMAKKFAELVKPNGRVYAIDIDQQVIEQLKIEIGNSLIQPMIADITQSIPIADGSIDLIYLSTVFHGFSLDQIKGFVDLVKRLLKPNAVLVILEMEKKQTSFGPPLNIRVSAQELKQLIRLEPKKTIKIGEDFYLQLFINKPL